MSAMGTAIQVTVAATWPLVRRQ